MDAILLLEAGFVRFVDDDDAEVAIGEEQGGTRPDDDLCLAAGDRVPGAAPFGGAQAGMPGDGLAAEARREAGQHRFGQRDFGEQDERLPAGLHRGGDRLHIDFGLARSGDRSEEHTSELPSLMRISYAVFCVYKKTERTP